MASESQVQRAIRKRTSEMGIPMLRYQVGTFIAPDGSMVKVGEPGVSDLIGMIPHTITEADVGRTVAVFAAMEIKKPGGRTARSRREAQGAFLRMVNRNGGLGAIVKSPEEAEDMVKNKWLSKFVIDYTEETQ